MNVTEVHGERGVAGSTSFPSKSCIAVAAEGLVGGIERVELDERCRDVAVGRGVQGLEVHR